MPPTLSLVVPVYNVAPYLGQSLDSLAAQDLSGMEIILVDDGSSDESPEILARYAARHPEMRIIRQENGGLSAARNTGLEHVRGEYVAFADSDDFIAPEFYTRLLAMARDNDLDMAHGNGTYHFEGRQPDHSIYNDGLSGGVMPGREVLRRRLREKSFLHMVWLHLYRRSFLEKLQMRFVRPYIHEDVPWTTRVFLAAERVAYDPVPGYHYRQRVRRMAPESKDERLQLIIDSSVYNAQCLDGMIREIPDDPELQRLIRWQLVDGGLSIFHKLRQFSSPRLRREYCKRLRADAMFGLLWRNAVELRQKRRIARNWLKSFVS
jgi:glycosyltransferase involved in cell wall biosynthesis